MFAVPGLHAADVEKSFQKEIAPYFKAYCISCHNEKKTKGKFRLDLLERDFGDEREVAKWDEVLLRINTGEMPPDDVEKLPKAAESADVVAWIADRIGEGRALRMARRGPVAHYRLSREEYQNTVFDLFGVYYDASQPGALTEDPLWHGFSRIGSMLSLSPSHVKRYFRAAEQVVELGFPTKPAKRETQTKQPKQDRWLLFPRRGDASFNVRSPGLYKVRVTLSALPSFKGRTPRLSIWDNKLKKSLAGRDVLAPEDKPTTIEIEVFLSPGGYSLTNDAPIAGDPGTLRATPKTLASIKSYDPTQPTGYKLFRDDGTPVLPLILADRVEVDGLIIDEAMVAKRAAYYPAKEDAAEARAALERFISQAWRRPPTSAEIDRYVAIMEAEQKAGETFRKAYLAAVTGVLVSKNFLYLREGDAVKRRDHVTDWELASRLSYFLWNSMPDETLFKAAAEGKLREKEVLRAEVRRMLAAPNASRFLTAFPEQWLRLSELGKFPPDRELYPDYDPWLEKSMKLETTGFFREVFDKNLSIREFLDSDWTILNGRLAMHYNMPAPETAGFQRVALRDGDHRGGIFTHASILSMTSDGTRHRPVHRGVWVYETLFAKSPPPPPANVEPLEPNGADTVKATIRQQIEKHSTHAQCASCHRKVDPFGFAFDNYDAIGRWRTHEKLAIGQGDDPPVNAAGKLPDGRPYRGPDEFRQLLAEDVDAFAVSFVKQLATYALRRQMTVDDNPAIEAIAAASENDDYRLRTIIENLVMSELFQQR